MFEYFTLFIVQFVRNTFVYQIPHEKEIRSTYEINTLQNGKCFERFLFTRWYVLLKKKKRKKARLFAALTHSFPDTSQLYMSNILTLHVMLGCTGASVGLTNRAFWCWNLGNDVSM